jgi:hypothetical protein
VNPGVAADAAALGAPTDVILRDGRTLRLRPPGPADRDALAAFIGALSPASLSARFHASLKPRAALIEPFLTPEWV